MSSWLSKRQKNQRSNANICWIEFQKNIYFCFIDYAKALDCVDHNKLENSERNGNTRPPDLPLEKAVCTSRSNSYNWTGTTDWFQIGKGVHQGYILSSCLFNLHAEYIMRNSGAGRSTSWNQDCQEKYKQPDTQMTPPLWQKVKKN